MSGNIKDIIFMLLMIAGLVYLWKCFYTYMLRNKQDKGVYIIIPINDTFENAEQLIRSTAQRIMLMGKNKFDKVICVDYGCNTETREIINRLCKEYGFLEYMPIDIFVKLVIDN
ncbi:MAG: hypothetical protein UH241_08075 [Acutalibacteraceae bacterium]|nr:hypothetical protein [Acutalibacteraceae bacterium]